MTNRVVFPIALALVMAGCAVQQQARGTALEGGTTSAVADRLFFGRSIPGGDSVSIAEWNSFVREVITPRFPQGLTVWSAEGQWREATGRIAREPAMVLEIIHESSVSVDSAFASIARAYISRFRQEAVLRVTLPARMQWYNAKSP